METSSRLGELWELSAEHFRKLEEHTCLGLYSITASSPEVKTLQYNVPNEERVESSQLNHAGIESRVESTKPGIACICSPLC